VTNGSGQLVAVTIPPEDDPAQDGRGWVPWLWALLVVLLVAGAAAAAYFLSRPKQVVVPPVVGESLTSARTQLQNAGFTVGGPYRQASGKPAGTVIGESPRGNAKADKGSTVALTVSEGRGKVTIPSVKGESKGEAVKTLKGYSLKVSRTLGQASSEFPSGQATGTNPGAGKTVPRGTPLALFISTGAPVKEVPNVKGQNAAAASATLHSEGFRTKIVRVVDGSVTAGQVLDQTPSSGKAAPGTTVTLTVAKRPASGTVPAVAGDQTAQAISALNSAGFTNVDKTYRAVRNPAKAGTVLAQRPSGSSTAAKSTTVTIVIGSYHGVTTSTSTTSSTTSTSTTSTSSSNPIATGGVGTSTQ
jgi:beta-lactam-binding protein with PASTA domain